MLDLGHVEIVVEQREIIAGGRRRFEIQLHAKGRTAIVDVLACKPEELDVYTLEAAAMFLACLQ